MAKELILSGIVQGVFCRKYCSDNAKRIGLKGSASNLGDGTVRVVINSDNEAYIQNYIHALKTNPYKLRFYGRIDNIKVSDYRGPIVGDYEF